MNDKRSQSRTIVTDKKGHNIVAKTIGGGVRGGKKWDDFRHTEKNANVTMSISKTSQIS